MTRPNPPRLAVRSSRRHNFTAILVSSLAIGFLYFNFDPTTAGADPDEVTFDIASLTGGPQLSIPDALSTAESASTGEPGSPTAQNGAGSKMLTGRLALLMNVLLLEKGSAELAKIPDYTATFFKRESIDDELGDGQVIKLKVRHQPFSVYMKWLVGDKGQEVLYVDGENDGKMVVHAGGWKQRLPALKLDPEGSLALSAARYPVTKSGILKLSLQLLADRRNDLERPSQVRCRMICDQKFDERDCYCFIIDFDSPQVSELYRKSIVHIDCEWSLPVSVVNYAWPDSEEEIAAAELDEQTLIEHYSFSDVQFHSRLADTDFDRKNSAYKFR